MKSLKSQNYNVFKAADGVEGLEVMEREKISLAIVDIMMPRMDGVTMTMKLRGKNMTFRSLCSRQSQRRPTR